MNDANHRLQPLLHLLRGLGSAVVAYSGGVDSTLLAYAAHRALRDDFLALTARTAFVAACDLDLALGKAAHLGFRYRVVDLDVWSVPGLADNGPLRCYLCKRAVLGLIREQAGNAVLLDGTNADDDPARPGRRALAELGVRSPLAEVGLTKAEVRALSRDLGLQGWDEPSNSCLATRLAEGVGLTPERLARVEALEDHCRALGLRGLRCRDRAPLLILEIDPEQRAQAEAGLASLEQLARAWGYERLELKDRT